MQSLKVSVAHGMGAIVDAGLWKEKTLRREDKLGKPEAFTVDSLGIFLA
jgi:hypothetical protein